MSKPAHSLMFWVWIRVSSPEKRKRCEKKSNCAKKRKTDKDKLGNWVRLIQRRQGEKESARKQLTHTHTDILVTITILRGHTKKSL